MSAHLGAPPGLSMPADLGAPPGLSLPQARQAWTSCTQSLYVVAVAVLQHGGPGHSNAGVGLAGGLAFVAAGKASKFENQSLLP